MSLSIAWGLDDTLEINEKNYQLNLEFSRVLRWYEIFRSEDESDHFKVLLTLASIAELTEEEIFEMEWIEKEELFLEILKRIFGEDTSKKNKDLSGNILVDEEPKEQYYDLIEDSPYIYASFRQDYGINLLNERGKMHWEEFNTLLTGLSETTKLRKVIEIRMMKIPEKCSEEERYQIIEAKKAVALKSNHKAALFETMDLLEKRKWYEKRQKGG